MKQDKNTQFDPRGYNRKTTVETRTDVRLLASFAYYYNENGEFIKSKSHLITRIIRDFAELLFTKQLTKEFDTSSEAIDYMRKIGLSFIESKTVSPALIKQLQDEEVKMVSDEIDFSQLARMAISNDIDNND